MDRPKKTCTFLRKNYAKVKNWLETGNGCARWFRMPAWFLLGSCLDRNEDKNAKSGVGHTISLMTIVLGGTIAFVAALIGAENADVEIKYSIVYSVAGLLPLGAMTSILRSSTTTSLVTCSQVWQGKGKLVKHHYCSTTIYITRWTVLSCFVLMCVGIYVAHEGWFSRYKTEIALPVTLDDDDGSLLGTTYEGKVKLCARVWLNKMDYSAVLPSELRCKITLAPQMASHWKIVDETPPCFERSPAGEYERIDRVAYKCEARSDRMGVEFLELKPNGYYRLLLHLVTKTQISDDRKKQTIKAAKSLHENGQGVAAVVVPIPQ